MSSRLNVALVVQHHYVACMSAMQARMMLRHYSYVSPLSLTSLTGDGRRAAADLQVSVPQTLWRHNLWRISHLPRVCLLARNFQPSLDLKG